MYPARRSRAARAVLAGAVTATSIVAVLPPPASADCGTDGGIIYEVDQARGFAFVGEYLGETDDGDGSTTHHWRIDRGIRSLPLGERSFSGGGCYDTGFRRGFTYAVSTAMTDLLATTSAIAYRVGADGRLHLVTWRVPGSFFLPELRAVDRMSEFLALYGPGLPPTDALVPDTSGEDIRDAAELVLSFWSLAAKMPSAEATAG